ncbi:MAG: ComF family protein [Bacteroidales bacterium]|nr:ComF family protein [Bacteroidales bacterium]MCM1146284.1 ComF family protein [Bacteroidales bacterium]MCM1205278.1 ComF family protein [Bacillota bacterium]MCM1509635.1 hypothetical protein [Clostridium sp.]
MLLRTIINAVFPQACLCCGIRLMHGEKYVCLRCVGSMPRPVLHGDHHDNILARSFWSTFPIEGAATAFCYVPDDGVYSIISRMKYIRPSAELCRYAGRLMATENLPSRIFGEGDLLLPVPVTASHRASRGYNQSEEICRGISEMTGLPVVTVAMWRHDSALGQAGTARHLRMWNVCDDFVLGDTRLLEHRHVVLVDDVITTGATIMGCLRLLGTIPGIRISVVAFGLTRG